MHHQFVLGVDPGLDGALALYDATLQKVVTVVDMPTYEVKVGKSKRQRVDIHELIQTVETLTMFGATMALVEEVGGRPKQSAGTTFVFGTVYGIILGVLASAGVSYRTTIPTVWKRKLRCPIEPPGIVALACQLMPDVKPYTRGPRGGLLHDRAEAAMIAYFGAHYMNGAD